MSEDKKFRVDAEGDYKWEAWPAVHWRAWGSWFSWGSPIGLGLFLISIGVFICLLHWAGLVG